LNGTKKTIKGKPCIYYDGYWIRRYEQDSDGGVEIIENSRKFDNAMFNVRGIGVAVNVSTSMSCS